MLRSSAGQYAARHVDSTHINVEVAATGNAAAIETRLAALPGVHSIHQRESVNGRVRVRVTTEGNDDVRPAIFELAKKEGWTLFELHQEARSLEDLVRHLTATPVTPAPPSAS